MSYVIHHKHFFIVNDNNSILNKNNILHYSIRLFLLHLKRLVANAILTEHIIDNVMYNLYKLPFTSSLRFH